MIILYFFFGFIAVLFLFRILFVGRIPKYEGIPYSGLSPYLTYLLEHALADGGTIHIEPEGMRAAMNITKRGYAKKPASVFITLSAGYVSREDLAKIAKKFEHDGIKCKLRYTDYRRALNKLTVEIPFGNNPVSDAVVGIIRSVLHTLGNDTLPGFTFFVYGPLKRGYLHEDGIVVKYPTSFVIVKTIGFFIGRMLRFFRGF